MDRRGTHTPANSMQNSESISVSFQRSEVFKDFIQITYDYSLVKGQPLLTKTTHDTQVCRLCRNLASILYLCYAVHYLFGLEPMNSQLDAIF